MEFYAANSEVNLFYCDVSRNNSYGTGGGLTLSAYSQLNSNAYIQNCTFYDNIASTIETNGIDMASNGSIGPGVYELSILNTIIWEKISVDGIINIDYSNTQNLELLASGNGNINEAPNFIDTDYESPNYNLTIGSRA